MLCEFGFGAECAKDFSESCVISTLFPINERKEAHEIIYEHSHDLPATWNAESRRKKQKKKKRGGKSKKKKRKKERVTSPMYAQEQFLVQ